MKFVFDINFFLKKEKHFVFPKFGQFSMTKRLKINNCEN